MSLTKQRGASLYTLSIVICVVIFFALLFVKLMPIYTDQYYLDSIVSDVVREHKQTPMSPAAFKETIGKRFQVNAVKFDMKNFKFEDGKLKVDYEERVNILFNIDAVVFFSNEYDWAGR